MESTRPAPGFSRSACLRRSCYPSGVRWNIHTQPLGQSSVIHGHNMDTVATKSGLQARSALIADVREHYDSMSPLYRTFWGEHIHHGYWRRDEASVEAQENLIHELATRARIREGESVLDVGCGLGGSSFFLAERYGATVTGISISPKQIAAATDESRERGLESQAAFRVQDAHRLDSEPGRFDIVWVVECSEHLFDKAKFVRDCARLLVPGGRLAICAWLAGDSLNRTQEDLVETVRNGMLCPSFGTMDDYIEWMEGGGLSIVGADDITQRVKRTWSLCRPVLGFPLVKTMLSTGGRKLQAFADSFVAIDEAYGTGAMRYGMFVAQKGAAPESGAVT
jgi:tocopherol O-methyltransferase